MSITFPTNPNMILSNQVENREGNTSKTLMDMTSSWSTAYNISQKEAKKNAQNGTIEGTLLFELNQDSGRSDLFKAYMKQSKMSTYFQDNPWGVLKQATNTGYQGPQLGGALRPNIA